MKNALADRYALEKELGRGGMAIVYLARDIRHKRLVALKVRHPNSERCSAELLRILAQPATSHQSWVRSVRHAPQLLLRKSAVTGRQVKATGHRMLPHLV